MNRKTVELRVSGLSNTHTQVGAFALVLEEVGGDRQLPVIIGAFEAQAVAIEMKGITPPRPLTHQLFANVLDVLQVRLLRVLIYRVDDGIFSSYLYLQTDDNVWHVDARTSDAVVLALRTGAKIVVYDDLLEAEGIRPSQYTESDETPTKSVEEQIEELKDEMREAIEHEEYERAAELRDRIKQLGEGRPQPGD